MRRADEATVFPLQPEGFAFDLSDEPILIDGMRVLFDTKVALYPVTVAPPSAKEGNGAA